MPRLLDLFCGRWGWSRAFAARGWECLGVDLVEPTEIPRSCHFYRNDILNISPSCAPMWLKDFDFIVASSPCEQFSVHGMKHFHPNPPYPELGIRLFNHTREFCESSGLPYVMENVRAAQQFVGNAVHHCGPFYLWGNAVPPILGQGISKSKWKPKAGRPGNWSDDFFKNTKDRAERMAVIPIELANCVADYAERLLEAKVSA